MNPPPFEIRDCALITISLGKSAQNLRELRDRIAEVPVPSLLHHFFETLLRPSFDDPEYANDFAHWAGRQLNDAVLAERLGIVDPLQFRDPEELRSHLGDVLEERLAEVFQLPAAPPGKEFQFLRSQMVVFTTSHRARSPEELAQGVGQLSSGSLFFHFIEARRRNPGMRDDFSLWLQQWPDPWPAAAQRLETLGIHHVTLTEIREQLAGCLSPRPRFQEVGS